MPYAVSYGRIYVGSCIFSVFNAAMNNIAASEGAARTALRALLSGAVLNLALDPIFIYALDMGVAGSAAATAISQLVSSLVYASYILRKKSTFSFLPKDFSPSMHLYAEVLKTGIPPLIFQLLTSLSIALTNRAASPYGDGVIAGMGAVSRVMSMCTLVVFGFLKGFQAVAGFSYGAGDFIRLKKAVKTSLLWPSLFCAAAGALLFSFSGPILSLFARGNAGMVLAGKKALAANGLSFFLFGFYTVYSSLLLALGKGAAGLFLGSCRQGLFFIPAILALPGILGVNGILYAQPAADILSAAAAVSMALSLHRELAFGEARRP